MREFVDSLLARVALRVEPVGAERLRFDKSERLPRGVSPSPTVPKTCPQPDSAS